MLNLIKVPFWDVRVVWWKDTSICEETASGYLEDAG
jgi:hypothetical protein